MATTPYTIRMDEELRKALEFEAELEDRPAAQLAARAIKSMLDAKSAKRRAIDDAIAAADAGRFISQEEMNAWIDSWESGQEFPMPQTAQEPSAG